MCDHINKNEIKIIQSYCYNQSKKGERINYEPKWI